MEIISQSADLLSNSRENLPKNRCFIGAKSPSAVLRCTFSCLRCTISCSWCTIWCSIWAVGAPANDLQVNLLSPTGALSALFFLCHYIGTESSWFLKRVKAGYYVLLIVALHHIVEVSDQGVAYLGFFYAFIDKDHALVVEVLHALFSVFNTSLLLRILH